MIIPITYFTERREKGWEFICYENLLSIFLPCEVPFFIDKWEIEGKEVIISYIRKENKIIYIEACDSKDLRRMYTMIPHENFRECARQFLSWEKFGFAEMKRIVKITGKKWFSEKPKG